MLLIWSPCPNNRTVGDRQYGTRKEIPHEGAFGDLVWSDPEDIEAWAVRAREGSDTGGCGSSGWKLMAAVTEHGSLNYT